MVTVQAHPRLVAVWAGVADREGKRGFSSGLLIAPRLVLTARHGVVKDGAALPGVEVAFMLGARGTVHPGEPVPGAVVWIGADGLDVGLIELAGTVVVPDGFLPDELRWGEPTGRRPVRVTVTGMPGFAAAATGENTQVETARGSLDPDTYTASERYAVNVDTSPGGWADWQGVSGAAVVDEDGGFLIGVTAWSDSPLAGRRLTAVPVHALLADDKFRTVLERHLGSVPDLEPVELDRLLSRPRQAGTPGALLRADAGVAEFAGREAELAELSRWRDERGAASPDIRVLLITGKGGEGKTRLALEFLARSKQEGWMGGLLRANGAAELPDALVYPGRPLLLIFDYAAGRVGEITSLARAIAHARPHVPVRLLLLARTQGVWWDDLGYALADDLPGLDEDDSQARRALLRPLRPLLAHDSGATDPATMFAMTAARLAPRLSRFTGRSPAEIRDLATRLTAPPESASGSRHVLTIQMAALGALLDAAAIAGQETGAGGSRATPASAKGNESEQVEDSLLRHELDYRNRLAAGHDLHDLRLVRDRAVLGAALFGARGPSQPDARDSACAIVTAALPELDGRTSRQREVAAWIAALYPPEDAEPGGDIEYWGTVLPDRLGEFLVVRLLAKEEATTAADTGLLASLAGQADPKGIVRALLTLTRAADHYPFVGDWIDRLISAHATRVGVLAVQVMGYVEHPEVLRSALIQLGRRSPHVLRDIAGVIYSVWPPDPFIKRHFGVRMTGSLIDIYGQLLELDRAAYLADLAEAFLSHGDCLAENGRHVQALTMLQAALAAYRELIGLDRIAHLPGLLMALTGLTDRLAENGRHEEALRVSAEAYAIAGELLNNDQSIPTIAKAATAWANHGNQLAAVGRREEAANVVGQAHALFSMLANLDRQAYLPDLASSLVNYSNRLADVRRHEEALATSEQAVAAYRELSELNRDVYLPGLATALNNHALRLAEPGRPDDARAASMEAITIRRQLAELNPDAYLPDLAVTLNNLAFNESAAGRNAEALALANEAITIRRQFTHVARTTYLDGLATSLSAKGAALFGNGQLEEATAACVEAIECAAELPENR